ncbi:MAG: hypothetical protein OXT70_01070 [Chloroflexota bacterium]|nr:hypothetical protein [Chloroflexota bacterium]
MSEDTTWRWRRATAEWRGLRYGRWHIATITACYTNHPSRRWLVSLRDGNGGWDVAAAVPTFNDAMATAEHLTEGVKIERMAPGDG